MSELLEIRWDRETEDALMCFLIREAQFPVVKAADVATPEMVELTLRRQMWYAGEAVRRLRHLLESRRVPLLDADVLALGAKAQERHRGTFSQTPQPEDTSA